MNRENRDQILFDNIAIGYSRKDTIASASIPRINKLMKAIKPILDQNKTIGNVVDVGCGVGSAAKHLKGKYYSYLGIDHSKELIKIATKYNEGIKNTTFICANVKSEELPSNYADTILAIGVLHHMTQLDEIMTALKRIAKPGAVFIAIEPIDVNPIVQLLRWIRGKVDPSYSEEQHFFSSKELKDLMIKNQLCNISLQYFGLFSKPFAEVIIYPQFIFKHVSRLFVKIDNIIDKLCPIILKFSAWDVIVRAKFPVK